MGINAIHINAQILARAEIASIQKNSKIFLKVSNNRESSKNFLNFRRIILECLEITRDYIGEYEK